MVFIIKPVIMFQRLLCCDIPFVAGKEFNQNLVHIQFQQEANWEIS